VDSIDVVGLVIMVIAAIVLIFLFVWLLHALANTLTELWTEGESKLFWFRYLFSVTSLSQISFLAAALVLVTNSP
jgi:flagellar biosynthesis protein FlhB